MPLFVVQRHDASTLHFDLRLEVAGMLASWAVPKGPSLDPREKRLAVRTDDHDLAHADVEGRVGQSRNGVGTVIVWDRGWFENLTVKDDTPVPAEQALEDGHLRFRLTGERLGGAFALTRTAMNGDDRNWILVKIDDEGADERRHPAVDELRSVISGRTNDDIAQEAP